MEHAIVKANHSQTQWKGRYNLPLCGKGSEELATMIFRTGSENLGPHLEGLSLGNVASTCLTPHFMG